MVKINHAPGFRQKQGALIFEVIKQRQNYFKYIFLIFDQMYFLNRYNWLLWRKK